MSNNISAIKLDGLRPALNRINDLRVSKKHPDIVSEVEDLCEHLFASHKTLAVYGSLKPGKENHHLISDIAGHWDTGYVHGTYIDGGWARHLGYPSMLWQPEGDQIPVSVLVSENLSNHWERLDRFEGADYQRILIPVFKQGEVKWVANIYESATKNAL